MDEAIVKLDKVSKRFEGIWALKPMDFRLEAGVSYGLIGRNGAGKSTLLKLMIGLLKPTAGEVRILGGDPVEDAEKVKVHTGYLAEDQSYPGNLRPADLFRFFRSCYPTWDATLHDGLVRRFRIPLDRPMSKLSNGQARQVGLLCAVSHRPRLLILDEPGGGLDPVARRQFLEQVIELLAGEKTTVIFSSHNLQEVERLADRIGILHHGEMLLEQDLGYLRENSSRLLVDGIELSGDRSAIHLQGEAIRARIPGCIRAARRGEAWMLSFLAAPEIARADAERSGARVIEAHPLSLEDLFIAMVGDAI